MSESKRFKRCDTTLEQLPNELFIEIFTYLTGVDTVYAFSQLNTRFQSLLIHYVNIFDFKSISKAKFDYVIQHHDIHLWQSLCLSDDEETPGQIIYFCQLYPPDQYISQLQSLCALNMTCKYAQEFVPQLLSFNHLVSLKIGNICGENIQPFEFPSLKRLVVTGCKHTAWMMNFYSLESLEYNVENNCHRDHVLALPTTLRQLKLLYRGETDENNIRASIRQLSQLTKLALHDNVSRESLPNGEIWEQFIQSSLPLLKTFQFVFCFHLYRGTLTQIQQAVASFSTPFYLFEKCWFIRCDYDCQYSNRGTLYSLPFAFAQMPINVTSFDTSMSTLITSDTDEAKYESYKKVKTILFKEKCQMPYRAFLTSNIIRLVLEAALPTNWYFLFINLRHLELRGSIRMSSTDFAQFLANTPQLQSLTVSRVGLLILTNTFKDNAVCDLLAQRIESLTICEYYSNGDSLGTVSVRFLSSLVHIFGKTCKHLSLGLAAHPKTVLPVLQRMRQLRSLHICYNHWCRASNVTASSWLEQPPTKTDISNFMHASDDYNFYIWFGNRL